MEDNKYFVFPCLIKCNAVKVCKDSERCHDYQNELSKWRKDIVEAILRKEKP